jgi:hypothetical protein
MKEEEDRKDLDSRCRMTVYGIGADPPTLGSRILDTSVDVRGHRNANPYIRGTRRGSGIMFEKLTTGLFLLGLLLEIGGFLLGSVDHIPSVLRVVSPGYVSAMQGLEQLEARKTLGEGDGGFPEISRLLLDELAVQNPPEKMAKVRVVSFRLTGESGIAFGETGVKEEVPILVTLSTGQELKWNLVTIREKVTALKSPPLFRWGLALFVTGVLLQIVGFVADRMSAAK